MKWTTSREAYEYLVSAGLLKAKQALVVDRLIYEVEATSGETIAGLQDARPADRSLRNVNAWRARFTELQQRGLIVEAGQRRCKVSGRRSVVWRFTGRTKPLKVSRERRGAKAWKALAMDLWIVSESLLFSTDRAGFEKRIRAIGGKP